MSGIVGALFGKPETPKAPAPPASPPRISDADASARDERAQLRRRKGISSTVLTHGLGGSGRNSGQATGTGNSGSTGAPTASSTLLGGGRRAAS